MSFVRALAAAFGALLFTACAPVATPPTPNSAPVEVTLTRGVCFGFCPDYTVTVTNSGQVHYVGRRFVNVVGEQHATIPIADAQRLIARFDAIGFDRLRDEYRANVSDLPTYTLSLTRNGRTKTVVDYGGMGAGMPDSVRALQDEVDRVANTARWVLRNGEPVRNQPR